MNETKYLWITNIPSKCKEEDVSRVLRRHGDIKNTKAVQHNSCFNLIVEYLDRSSAARAVRSQNLLKGSVLKVDYCDSLGNPWIASASNRNCPLVSTQYQRSDRKSETMLVDRAGHSSAASNHHHHSHQSQPTQQHQSSPHQLRFQPATSPPSSTSRERSVQGTGAITPTPLLKVVFTPPPKYAETQIKQTLCHELHKFGKTHHVKLLPAVSAEGRQTRVALVVFRRVEDEERAFLTFRNAGRCLFGSPVHVEFCSDADPEAINSNPRIRPSSTTPAVPVHSSIFPNSSLAASRITRSPTFSLPTRSLIIHGLTAGPNGPVSEVQLNTAFQKFGAILHVQMRPASSSAIIEFVELRGSTRAMTTHLRDPLRLGGRPLRLLYTPSRPVNCLFVNDLPASLIHHSEGELKTLFSRVVPVAQVFKITRSQEASANTTVHSCALFELASQELATQLLEYLRSPDSPLVVAAQSRSSESITALRMPTFVCSVDYASPRQMGKVITPTKAAEAVRPKPMAVNAQPPPTPLPFDVINEKPRNSVLRSPLGPLRPRDPPHYESSEEEHSQNSSASNSSLHKRFTDSTTIQPPPPPPPVATFPSQRRSSTEAPLFISHKRFPESVKREQNRNHASTSLDFNSSEKTSVCESMYDKIKRRTEGEKERRKRPSLESEEGEESRLVRRKKRRKQIYRQASEGVLYEENVDENDYEGSEEDLEETMEFLKEKHKIKHSDSPSRHRRPNGRPVKNPLASFSQSSVEGHRQKSRIVQPLSKPVSTTITRLSLGMSVPMTANYHTISKTSVQYGQRRLSRLSSPSTDSRPGSATSEDVDIKSASVRRSSVKGTTSPLLDGKSASIVSSVGRSLSLNDVDSASGGSSFPFLSHKRMGRQRDHVRPPTSSVTTFKKKDRRKIPFQPTVFRPSKATSSSFSTGDEGEEKTQECSLSPSKCSSNVQVRLPNNINSSRRRKLRSTPKVKAKTRRTHSPNGISSSSSNSNTSSGSNSSRNVSSADSSKRRRRSLDVENVNASTPLSCGSRLAKPTPPSRASDFHGALSDPDEGYSLDDFDRFSANTAMTPSTEAMEISPETGDEEADHQVSEWFTRMSSNHSESEMEQEKERLMEEEEENGDGRSDDQKPMIANFEDINILNTSKEDSLNLSNRDAIGDIGIDDRPSPRLNDNSDKSTSKSLLEETTETVKPPPPEDLVSPAGPPAFKPQKPPTPPKLEAGTLPPPPPPPPNVQQVLSPYSSSSPTQSLCSACSRSSPSPIITASMLTSRAGAATNATLETTTCVRTTVSVTSENANVKPIEKLVPLSENRDLKRYVQSVIERVKAESVDDSTAHRTVASITPITSPMHHLSTASSPPPPPPPLLPSSLTHIGRKGASPAYGRRMSGATPPGVVVCTSSPNARSGVGKMIFDPSGNNLPSIPGVNACAPLSDVSSLSPIKGAPEVALEPKALRSATRRRAKTATVNPGTPTPTTATTTAFTAVRDLVGSVPKQPTDPYEPNFDDDSPPLVKSNMNVTSPLVVNTSLASEHVGPASTVSSVTTTEESVLTNEASKGSSTRRSGLDSVDETITDVCCGRFDMRSYLDSWGLQPLTSNTRTGPATPSTTTPATTPTLKTSESKAPLTSAATSNPIFTAIINALQSITGNPVVIGGGANNNSGGLRQSNPGSGQQIPQKTSTVVVGSSPPTISATTITFPVFFKNVFSAANNSPKSPPASAMAVACPLKTSVANSHPVKMTTTTSNTPHQQHRHVPLQQVTPTVAMSRPQSSTTDSVIESPHPYRVRRNSDNNGVNDDTVISTSGSTGQLQQRPVFNPRSFTSPPPRYPPFSSPRHVPAPSQPPPPPPLSHPPTPWSVGPPMPTFPRSTRQDSTPATTNTFFPGALLEKLSCLIEPDLVLPMLQAAIQEGHHLDPDLLASIAKMFQQYTAGGGGNSSDGGGLPPSSNASNSAPSPPQTTGGGGSGQYHHFPRAGGTSTPPTVPRTGSFDQTYPLVWQGRLSLKNAEVSVALHYVQGNADLLRACISTLAAGGGGSPQQALVASGGPLRIVQRMRLEASQLDAVQRKITQEGASCACVAFASGANRADLAQQNIALSEGFIRYMLEKSAAGIINVGQPGTVQGLYVVHIFPPCDFSHALLRLAAPDLHQSILQAQLPHLLIVITTV